jgi:hypothetical protein
MQSPFGRPLFDRLGLGAGTPAPSRALPLPEGFARAAAQSANRTPIFAPMPSYMIPQRVMALRDSPPRPLPFVPQRQTPSSALPLPQGYDPNVNQPSIGFFDGVNGLPSNPFADIVYRPGPGTSLTALNQMTAQQGQPTMARAPGPDPFNGRPVPLPNPGGGGFAIRESDGAMVPLRPGGGQQMPQFGPPMGSPTSSVEPDYTGFVRRMGPQGFEGPKGGFLDLTAAAPPPGGLLTGSFGPSIVVPPQFRQPGDMSRYVAFNDRGQPGAGFSNYEEYLAAGNSPAIGGIATSLGSTGNSVQPGIGMFPLIGPPLTGTSRPPNIGPLPNPDEGFDMSNPMPLLTGTSRPPFLTNSVVLPESGFSTVGPGSAPANVQPISSGGGPGQTFLRPGIGIGGISNGISMSSDGISNMAFPEGMTGGPGLRPPPGGLLNMAFPTLAPSRPNTFTGGLFGGNNPMNNNPMNGGGMNSNQPLSQQIPQVVQQAVTPLLQNTATQLNQGIGSMVNQSLVGGGGQTGSGGGGLPAFGGTPAPSNLSNFLLGGGFNPFR